MKKTLILTAAFAALALVAGCNKSSKTEANMGAVSGEKASCCKEGDKASCKDGDKAKTCTQGEKAASGGACCKQKTQG